MNKVVLMNNEKIKFQVKFSSRIVLIDFLFLIFIMSLASSWRSNLGSFVSVILLFIFIPLVVKTIFDFYRVMFHRVYITNIRLLYSKGTFFRNVRVYNIKDITGVYFKSNLFDRGKNMTKIKVTLKNNNSFILINVKDGNYIAQLLSTNLIKMHENKKSGK